jgi:hypothetical protein
MRFRTTLLLAGALALLSLGYYLLEIREARKETEKKLAAFDEGAVTGFSIRRGERLVTLTKDEGAWRMRQPVEDRADEREIGSLLGNLTRAKIERTLDADKTALTDFGLEKPAIVLTVNRKDQEQPFILEVGGPSPAGIAVYARRHGESQVFLIPATVKTSLDKDPFAFRSKAPLAFDRNAVKAVRLHTGSLRIRLERQEKTEWRMTEPAAVKADAAKVAALLLALTHDQVKSFLDQPPPSLKSLGLDPPRGEIAIGLDGGAEATLLLGAHKKGEGVYARRDGTPALLVLKEDFLKEIPEKAADLRDRTLLSFDQGQVAEIELHSPAGRVLLKREADTWRIKEPEEASADQQAVGDLLWDLSRARVKDFVTDRPRSLKPFGLDTPAVRVRLGDASGKALASLALNRAPKGEGSYVRVGDTHGVALVESRLYEQLSKGPSAVRFRRLLTFEIPNVTRVALSRNGEEIVLEKRKEEWALKKPREGKAKYSAVLDLLESLRNLKWEKVMAKAPTDLHRYGLDKPAAAVTLTTNDGKAPGTLIVGTTEGDLAYAKMEDRPEIYAIPSSVLKSLPADPATLLE